MPLSICILFSSGLMLLLTSVHVSAASNEVSSDVRPVPPPGIAIPPDEKTHLLAGLEELRADLDALKGELKNRPGLLSFLPDVEIYEKAVRYAVIGNELYQSNEVRTAYTELEQGRERAKSLRAGQAPWNSAAGLVARGYRSRIDGSVQPYGLVVPESFHTNAPGPYRLDIWLHGRGESLSELNFINDRQRSRGEVAPPNAFVLHLYGRYCNANKFAGEIDLFEALDDVRQRYPIDENRLVVRGFSMGGAACWQFAAHYPGMWAAAAPGAGFAETANFLKVFQNESVAPAWYEQKLWHLYDCTDYALNFFNCPVVAYSGEIDKQKQAADVMAEAMAREGLVLDHIIGPRTAHAYHPAAREEINRRIDSLAARGRDPAPRAVHFTTWTLRYHQAAWLTVDRLGKHWERARVDAELLPPNRIRIQTTNVAGLSLAFPPGYAPFDPLARVKVEIDGSVVEPASALSDRSWNVHLEKERSWKIASQKTNNPPQKIHGLQGPIDDAFMDSFIMVAPGGESFESSAGRWTKQEQTHAIEHWRRQFRGDCRVVQDDALTASDIESNNLVLWGDPQSNRVLGRLADQLPIQWKAGGITVGGKNFSASQHVLLMIYPNPLNPRRYVVLNSGFTFREYDYLNNARQIPKLPDYAILNIESPPTARAAGRVVEAGFFDEDWKLGKP